MNLFRMRSFFLLAFLPFTAMAQSTITEGPFYPDHAQVICRHGHSVPTLASTQINAQDNGSSYWGPCEIEGDRRTIGQHAFTSFVQQKRDGTPWAIGFKFSEQALMHLPHSHTDAESCFDKNANGTIDVDHGEECVGGHSAELNFGRGNSTPFSWGLINWNQHGHMPSGVYDKPHFDFHFYLQDFTERNLIRLGPCALLIHCDDYAKATQLIPAPLMPEGYLSVGAAEGRMGDHLVNLSAPEFNGEPFSQTFIFGGYVGRLSFYEPMISLEFLQSKPFVCYPIAAVAQVSISGWYPQSYCVLYYPARKEYRVSLNRFIYRAKGD